MKKLLFILALFSAHVSTSQSLEDFSWLIGKWERHNVKPGTSAFEVWNQTNVGYEGIGVSLKESDTTFVERLKMIEKDGEIFYVADVSANTAAVYFKVTSYSESGFVSENPEHDFPKKIEYILEGDRMTAIISDGEKKMGFVFAKIE